MQFFKVDIVTLRFSCRVTTFLANVDFRAAFFVSVIVCLPVHLQTVALQRAALGEGLLTQVALVRSNA